MTIAKKKKKEKTDFHRAYPLELWANDSKVAKICEVYNPYKKAMEAIAKYQWRLLIQGGISFSSNRDWLPTSVLIQRYLREAEYQTVEILNSYLSNRQNDFRKYVQTSSLDDETKHKLHTINVYKAWFYREAKEAVDPRIANYQEVLNRRLENKKKAAILLSKPLKAKKLVPYISYSPEIFKLARLIIKQTFRGPVGGKKSSKPTYKNPNMKLSSNVAKIVAKQENPKHLPEKHDTKKAKKEREKETNPRQPKFKRCKDCHSAKKFSYWVQFSTLESGKPIFLPLQDYGYFKKKLKKSKLCQKLQFNFDEFENVGVSAILEKATFSSLPKEEQEQRLLEQTGSKVPFSGDLAIDTGMVIPIVTCRGSLHGHTFYSKLKMYDEKIQKLTKELNRNKIPWKTSKHYLRLRQDMRGFMKNEIRRILNRLVSRYRPSRIIIDKLDFRNSRLSRRMNRLLRNFGVGIIRKKLESLFEELGIEIVWINPAYTSQECDRCHYISRKNRRGRKFKCRLCSYTLHSDVSGARRGEARSSSECSSLITLYTKKEEVFRILTHRFIEQFDTYQTKKPDHWLLRLRSKARILIKKNTQYKDLWKTPVFLEFLGPETEDLDKRNNLLLKV